MRLWHIDLLAVLPREQLVAQWRECSAIAGSTLKKGTPNHLLVNFILDYDFDHFISYTHYVRQEMFARGYQARNSVWDKIISLKTEYTLLELNAVYSEIMTQEYKTICYYNLKEKYLRGGISSSEWLKISEKCEA